MESNLVLIVRVELLSAVTGDKKEIACMIIANDGTSQLASRGDYDGWILKTGPEGYVPEVKFPTLRKGRVENHKRLTLSVWNLVLKMLQQMKY